MAGTRVGSIETGVRLDRALTRAARREGGGAPREAQAFGQVLSALHYADWRETMLERSPTAVIATVEGECFGVVLWVMRPTALRKAVLERRMRELLSPPYIGVFEQDVRPDVAFAHTLASWLDAAAYLGPLVLLPPVVETREDDGRHRHFLLMMGTAHYQRQ